MLERKQVPKTSPFLLVWIFGKSPLWTRISSRKRSLLAEWQFIWIREHDMFQPYSTMSSFHSLDLCWSTHLRIAQIVTFISVVLLLGWGIRLAHSLIFFLTEKLWPKSVKKDDHFNTRYLFPSSLPTCLIQAEAGRLKGRAAEVSQAGRWVSAPISQTLCRWQFSKMTPWLGEPHDLMMGNPWQLKMSTSQRSVIFLGAGRRMSCVSEYAWDFPQWEF